MLLLEAVYTFIIQLIPNRPFEVFVISQLNFEFVYYIATADYNEYMDIQQDIYLHIYKIFEEQQIEFAFPTQTVFVEHTNNKTPTN